MGYQIHSLKKQYETFLVNGPIIAQSKNINCVWVRAPGFREGQVRKSRAKIGNCHFPGKSGAIGQFFSGKIKALFLHILGPNYHSFYLKCLRKYQKTYNLDIF